LLELVCLVGVMQDKGIEEAMTSDLEFDHISLAAPLDPGSYG
jgi:hypothetical protein